jgi:hypothetical protein
MTLAMSSRVQPSSSAAWVNRQKLRDVRRLEDRKWGIPFFHLQPMALLSKGGGA